MYRATYAQKTAVQLYYAEKPHDDVVQMLLAEGAPPEQAEELARSYYSDYLAFRLAAARAKRKKASMFVTIGAVLVGGSIALSFLMYLMIDDDKGSFIGYYGLLGLGMVALAKGLVDKRQAEMELQQIP